MRKWLKDWEKLNPILADGEVGEIIGMLETKTGDGKTPWNELLYTGESDSVGTFSADDIPVTTSGLVVVSHTDVQAALADLDAAQASHAADELLHSSGQEVNYVQNDTGTITTLSWAPISVDLLTFSIPATSRPVLVRAQVHIDFDTIPADGTTASINLFIANGLYTNDFDTDYVGFTIVPVYHGTIDDFVTVKVEGRLAPSASARVVNVYSNANSLDCHVMNGAIVPKAFKSWMQATYC